MTFAEIAAPDAVGVSALVTHACPSAGMPLAHGDLQAYSVNAEQGDPSHVPSEGLKLVCAVEEWMSIAEAREQSACDAARAHALAVWLSSASEDYAERSTPNIPIELRWLISMLPGLLHLLFHMSLRLRFGAAS